MERIGRGTGVRRPRRRKRSRSMSETTATFVELSDFGEAMGAT